MENRFLLGLNRGMGREKIFLKQWLKKKLKKDHGLLWLSNGYNTASNAEAGAQLRSRGPSSTVKKKKKRPRNI